MFFFFFPSPPEQLAASALLLPRGALLLPGHQCGNQSAVPAHRHLHVLLLDVWVPGTVSSATPKAFDCVFLTYIGGFSLHVTKPIDHFETKKTSRARNWKSRVAPPRRSGWSPGSNVCANTDTLLPGSPTLKPFRRLHLGGHQLL